MDYFPYYHSVYSPISPFPACSYHRLQTRTYPPVDIKNFTASVKSFRFLMGQGNLLLDRLSEPGLARKIMSAAQQGNKAEVDKIMKTLGLKVPIITRFTPSGVVIELVNPETHVEPFSCCSLSFLMKW